MENTTNFKFLSNFRHGYMDISSEMFWGGGFHHQLEQSIASSPHEPCMEKFYGPKTLKRMISSDDLSREKISSVHPLTNTFKVNVQEKRLIFFSSGLWWSVLRSYCMIEIIQDKQLQYQYHIILRGMVPFGSNMFTTHFRIQPLKVVSESVASVISKSQIAPRSPETFWEKHFIVWPHRSASPLATQQSIRFVLKKITENIKKTPFFKVFLQKKVGIPHSNLLSHLNQSQNTL